MSNPIVTINGRVGTDPEIREFNGNRVITFRVITADRKQNDSGTWEDKDTSGWSVSAWNNLCDNSKNIIKESEEETVNLTKWVSDAMRYSKGMGNEDKLNSYQYNNGPAIPLPEGEMFFFKDTKFDTSCCPGSYTNSKGCACLSKKQFQYLTMRAGNNTVPNNKTSYFNEF